MIQLRLAGSGGHFHVWTKHCNNPACVGLAMWQLLEAMRGQREQASEPQAETPNNKRRPRNGVAGRVRAAEQARNEHSKDRG